MADKDKVSAGDLVKPLAETMGVNTKLPLNEALYNANLKNVRGAIDVNGNYMPKQSVLWSNLFWRIAEDTVERAIYNSKFSIFSKPMDVGGDLAEDFIRIKKPQDRTQLSNSDLLVDYVDTIDIAIHRVNHMERFATTFLETEARKVFQSWETLQSFIAACIDNLQQSYEINTDRQILQELVDGYAAGEINARQLATDSAAKAIQLNTVWDEFTIEASPDFVGYNLNSNSGTNKIENISQRQPYLIIEAEMMRNIEFLDALSLYFTRVNGNNNDLFSRVIKIKKFPSPSATITPGDGYTAVTDPKQIRAMLVDEDFIKYRTQFKVTSEFQNAATLKSNVYVHYDNLISFSPFMQGIAFTD